jgi:large-conductance mechanosensitive channel
MTETLVEIVLNMIPFILIAITLWMLFKEMRTRAELKAELEKLLAELDEQEKKEQNNEHN